MCSLDPGSGLLYLSSYRDPAVAPTLKAYEKCGDALRDMATRFDSGRPEAKRELAACVVGAVGDRDAPASAAQRGAMSLTRYLSGIDTPMRQAMRDEVLATGPAQFRDLAGRIDSIVTDTQSGAVAVVGGEEGLKAFGATAAGAAFDVRRVLPRKEQ
jgi:Zn-dependent M16 (insulinase) family peptidase